MPYERQEDSEKKSKYVIDEEIGVDDVKEIEKECGKDKDKNKEKEQVINYGERVKLQVIQK